VLGVALGGELDGLVMRAGPDTGADLGAVFALGRLDPMKPIDQTKRAGRSLNHIDRRKLRAFPHRVSILNDRRLVRSSARLERLVAHQAGDVDDFWFGPIDAVDHGWPLSMRSMFAANTARWVLLQAFHAAIKAA
jgi:hypothetical protein